MNRNKRFVPSEGSLVFHWARFDIPYRYVAAGILCLGVVLRLLGLNKGLWSDEYYSLEVVSSPDFLHALRLQNKPPLFYLAQKLCAMISTAEPLLRLTSVCFGVGTLVLVMIWIKRRAPSAALLAGLLCATIPVMLRYSQEIRGYSLLLFAEVCSFYFASRLAAAPEESSSYFGLSLGLTVAAATHLAGIMLTPAAILFIAFSCKDPGRIRPAQSLAALAVPSLTFLYFYLFFLQGLPAHDDWWMPAVSVSSVASTMREVLGISYLLAAQDVIRGQSPLLAVMYAYAIKSILLFLCVGLVFFGDWRRSLPFFVAATCYWAELLVYSLLAVPIFWYRIALPGLLPFIGFVALQIDGVRMKRVKRAVVVCVVIICTLFAAGWAAHSAWLPYEEWKPLSESLKAQWTRNDLVIFYPACSEGLVRYYFPSLPPERGLPVDSETETKRVAGKIRERLSRLEETAGRCSVFLVARNSMNMRKDARTYRRVLSYLESECSPAGSPKKFGNLSLSKYECPLPQ